MKKSLLYIVIPLLLLGEYARAQNSFPASGNVGIGTTAPQTQLQVNGQIYAGTAAATNGTVIVTGRYNSPTDYLNILGTMYSSGGTLLAYALSPSNFSPVQFNSSTSIPIGRAAFTIDGDAFRFFTAPRVTVAPGSPITTTEVLAINNSGTVKIGNVNVTGSYKLFVETGILTEKVKVAVRTSADWADHVFNKNYPLMPLKQVEAFVQQHKHLPGVPAADEMVKQGNDLGKTDALLLQKIEELTLYIIQQQKKIEALEQKINAPTGN
ncbi:MAG: hypothetical protein JNM68_04710 [Dinghuibacter sp.]|nr:hypothetical protein [Dinghuibacter sp.]